MSFRRMPFDREIVSATRFLKRRCDECLERKEVAYSFSEYTYSTCISGYYCKFCGDEALLNTELIEELKEKARIEEVKREKRRKEKEKEEKRINYLEQEIKRVKIEREAKEFGISYPGD